jgi:hypothetical protein
MERGKGQDHASGLKDALQQAARSIRQAMQLADKPR